MKKTSKWLILSSSLIILVGIGFFLMNPAEASMEEAEVREMITEQYGGTINTISETSYEGAGAYKVELLAEGGIYTIFIERTTGDILLLERSVERESVEAPIDEEPSTQLTVEEVEAMVKGEYGERVEIRHIELLEDGGSTAKYEIIMEEETGRSTLVINAETGETVNYSLVDKEEDKEPQPREPIGEAEAIEIALGQVSGEVDDVDLEEKDGRLYYEIEIENAENDIEADVWMDALTGEVINIIWDN